MPKKYTLAKLGIKTIFKIEGKEMEKNLYHLVDAEKIKNVSKERIEKEIAEKLKLVSPRPVSAINRLLTHYSIVDPQDSVDLGFANMFVEVHIPYCLHLPSGIEVNVNLSEKNIKAKVVFFKVWTKRAEADGVLSDDVDFYMEGAPTYFQKGVMLTPKIPLHLEEGWDQYFTGTNVERIRDQNGIFRYTRLLIEFEPNLSPEQMKKLDNLNREGENLLEQISENIIAIINRAIDCYRYTTKQAHIERLGIINIHNIYFKKENIGFNVIGLFPGIETAVMNRSKEEIENIKELLETSTPIPLYELLILDSHSAFNRKAFTLAIVESFQALEIMLENYLITAFTAKGVPQNIYEKKMDTHWKTKERLNELLNEVKSHSLKQESALWQAWHTKYDKVRNEVIHQGKQITEKETDEVIKTNEKVIDWLNSLK